MLNGLKVIKGEIVKFTMFSNWTYEQNKLYAVKEVGKMDSKGWFDIKLEGEKDWACCMHFSKT